MGIRTCTAAFALLVVVAAPARADLPPVIYIAQAIQPGASPVDVGIVGADGARELVLDDAPTGSWGLAAHAATGRYALTFLQLPTGDPLTIGGQAVSKPSDVAVLLFGDRAHGLGVHVAGDPKCTNRKTACFQGSLRFSDDGAYVFVESQAASWTAVNRWVFGAVGKPAPIADSKTTSLRVSSDGAQLAVVQPKGIALTAWPAQPTDPRKKAVRVKAGKIVATPKLLMSDAWPIEGALFYFRREPVEQKRGYLEAYDLARKTAATVLELPDEFPMWRHQFLFSRARQAVIFAADVGFERATLYEAPLADLKPRAVVADAHALLDVSVDGRYALMAAYRAVAKGNTADNPEDLWIVELATGKVTRRDLGVPGARVIDARFVGAP